MEDGGGARSWNGHIMKLYACLGSGNCFKPWLAMTQLGMDFELSLIDVLSGEQKSEDYLAVNPNGVVPFLDIGGGRGIGESNAMLWYLAEGTELMPQAAADRAEAHWRASPELPGYRRPDLEQVLGIMEYAQISGERVFQDQAPSRGKQASVLLHDRLLVFHVAQ